MKNLLVIATLMVVANALMNNTRDPSSYANIDEIRSTHLYLDFTVDFERKKFVGSVYHTMEMIKPNTPEAVFDFSGIDIKGVRVRADNWVSVGYSISSPKSNIGSVLRVPIPMNIRN
jgi:leukotriene-A4 hydrolase